MFDEIASVGLHAGPILVGRCLCPEFSGTKAESQKFRLPRIAMLHLYIAVLMAVVGVNVVVAVAIAVAIWRNLRPVWEP
jgi:hypothetical protein